MKNPIDNLKINIAFTICCNNYLAKAITLGNSIKVTNPEIIFRIYLVDRLIDNILIKENIPFTIIEIETVPIPDFEGMTNRYNIVELSTSVKPFIFDHIFVNEPCIQNIIYFDPDIMLFNSCQHLFNILITNNIILTPHLLTPSENHPYGQPEANYLSTGIFNLGFIAVKRSEESFRFLIWWKERLTYQAFCKHEWHLFYDQKWMNLAITFFDGVYIEKNAGYNMAGWNLHERILNKLYNVYYINEIYPLIFYHFSGVIIDKLEQVSSYTKYTFENRPDLFEITNNYRLENVKNGHNLFKDISCAIKTHKLQITSNNITKIYRKFKEFKIIFNY